jgi:DNA-binding response OmpR family regulator
VVSSSLPQNLPQNLAPNLAPSVAPNLAPGVAGAPPPAGWRARRALVVDDERALAALVASYLEADGFAVRQEHDGPSALAAAREEAPEVIVLDLSLPGLDGIEVARRLRTFSDAYLIMLTARAEEVDKLIGLAVGADDYLTKPFSPRELVARVRVLLRRPRWAGVPGELGALAPPVAPGAPVTPAAPATAGEPETPGAAGALAPSGGDGPYRPAAPMAFGELIIDIAAREVRLAGRVVALTRTEFDLLATLASCPAQVFTRVALLRVLWGPDWVGDAHAVDVHLAHVRQKLGDSARDQRYIKTIRGIGYRMGQVR